MPMVRQMRKVELATPAARVAGNLLICLSGTLNSVWRIIARR